MPALNQIYEPDDVWKDIQDRDKEFEESPEETDHHNSIFVLALIGGYLKKITSPIHRYLLQGNSIHPETTKQCLKDLPEK